MARPNHRRSPLQQLRTAIDCLPVQTRVAMLEGVRANDIIVGAYADRRGGICPMLAAHRCGGRTDFISFARAWDRFAGAKRSRQASERELLILTAHLEASILHEEAADSELKAAIADHRRLAARPKPKAKPASATRRPGDPDRANELKAKPGWSWLRPFRRYDDYQRALERLEAERESAERELETSSA
jgi:hypothetical protein